MEKKFRTLPTFHLTFQHVSYDSYARPCHRFAIGLFSLILFAASAQGVFAQQSSATWNKAQDRSVPNEHLDKTTSLPTNPLDPIRTTAATLPTKFDPMFILSNSHTIFIKSKSVYLKSSDLENELRKRFLEHGLELAITTDQTNAELVMEIGRRAFSTTFIYSVIDPHTGLLISSGKVNSLGGTVPTKIAKKFIHALETARSTAAQK